MIKIESRKEGNESVQTEVTFFEETLWLTEKQIAALFGRDRTVVGRHIKTIFRSGELEEKSNVQKMHIAHSDKPIVNGDGSHFVPNTQCHETR